MFRGSKFPSPPGRIEVICGCMFSGKTEELILRLNKASAEGLKVKAFKPEIDKRYHDTDLVSHNGHTIASVPLQSAQDMLSPGMDADVAGIDEAQFFDTEIILACKTLAERGTRIILAGLDTDYLGNPFGSMPALMALAQEVTRLEAICMVCGNAATHSFRKTLGSSLIMLGEKESYEARCVHCFDAGMTKDG